MLARIEQHTDGTHNTQTHDVGKPHWRVRNKANVAQDGTPHVTAHCTMLLVIEASLLLLDDVSRWDWNCNYDILWNAPHSPKLWQPHLHTTCLIFLTRPMNLIFNEWDNKLLLWEQKWRHNSEQCQTKVNKVSSPSTLYIELTSTESGDLFDNSYILKYQFYSVVLGLPRATVETFILFLFCVQFGTNSCAIRGWHL